jgi:hypothetical protein
LTYCEYKLFDGGYRSAASNRKARYAIVLKDSDGEEVLLTVSEARIALAAGVKIPLTVL